MNLLLEEYIVDIPKDMETSVSRIDYAIYLAREESPTWSSYCKWDAWIIRDIDPLNYFYCVTKLSKLP